MTFVQRYTAPLLARIPDVSEVPTGRLVLIGVVVSLLLHLLAFLMIPLISLLFRDRGVDFANASLKPRNIELQIIPPEEEHIQSFTLAPPPPDRMFLDSRGLDSSKDPADHPLFESDENMKAASEQPATGDLPLPGQMGKDRSFSAFQTTRSLLGPMAEPFAPAPPSAQPLPQPPPPSVQVAQQEPDNTPPAPTQANNAPQAQTPPPPDAKKTEEKDKDKPMTAENVEKKVQKLKEVEKLLDDEIAVTKREAVPKALTQIEPPANTPSPVSHAAVLRPIEAQPQQMAKLTTPAPRPQPQHATSGYQPEQEKNRIESSISNRGKSAVDAIATPMARYRKAVNDAIGSRWYYYIHDKMDLIAFGSVRISFVIDTQGHISGTRVVANTSNQSLADVSMRAVHDAEIGPPPSDPGAPISTAPLEWTLTFTYYPFSQ
jgi:outer membrane biosynthesis protein TonB